MVARLKPLDPPYEPGIERTLERLMGGTGSEPLKLFRTIAHNPHLLDKLRSTGSYLLNFGAVDPMDREIVILRTCARCRSEYEWGVHVAIYSEHVGLSPEQVAATVLGSHEDPAWSERQALLMRLVDELHDTSRVSSDTWEGLAAEWTPSQLVELLTLVGQYHSVSYVANAFEVDREEFGARFPTPA